MENTTSVILTAAAALPDNGTTTDTVSPIHDNYSTVNFNTTTFSASKTRLTKQSDWNTYHKIFNVYFQWPLVIIGVVCNLFIIVIIRKKTFRHLTMSMYFSVLAVTDCIALIGSGFNQSLKETDGIRLFSLSKSCGIMGFMINVGSGSSGWIIVVIAIERLLVVAYPVEGKVWISKTKAKIACVTIIVLTVILNSYNLWMVDYTKEKCFYLEPFTHFSRYGKGYYSLFLFGIIPFSIVSLCYALVVGLMYARKKKKKELIGRNTTVNNYEKQTERLTAMCLAICLAFLVLFTPSQIYILVARMKGWIIKPPEAARIVETLVFFVRQLNYATNFIINIVSNKQFKMETSLLLTKRRRQVAPTSSPRQITQSTAMNHRLSTLHRPPSNPAWVT